jgi:hypothetical protein
VLASAQLCGGKVRELRAVGVVPARERVAMVDEVGTGSGDPRLALAAPGRTGAIAMQ